MHSVPSERNEADRPAIAHLERPDAIQRVELIVKRIAAILCHQHLVAVGKVDVVERVVLLVAKEEDRNPAAVSLSEVDTEDGTPRAACR
jgi:hypothetical protein